MFFVRCAYDKTRQCFSFAVTLHTYIPKHPHTVWASAVVGHLQVTLSLEQSQWGREFKTAGNNAAIHIEGQHCRLKLPLQVEDSVNTVLELMLCLCCAFQPTNSRDSINAGVNAAVQARVES